MTDTPDTVAMQLLWLARAANSKATSVMPPTILAQPSRTPRSPDDALLRAYEEAQGRLTVTQRGELGRILEIMLDAFESPPGAAIPPG